MSPRIRLLVEFPQRFLNIVSKKTKSLIASFVFTALLFVIILMNISLTEVVTMLKGIDPIYVALGCGFHLLAYIFRVQSMFMFFTDSSAVSYKQLLLAHFIHNFYSHLLPASLGELSFPLLLKKSIPTSKTLSVLLITRMLILIVSFFLFLISVYFIFPDIIRSASEYFLNVSGIIIFLTVVTFIGVLYHMRNKISSYLSKKKFFGKFYSSMLKLFQTLKTESYKLRNRFFASKLLLLTFAGNISIIIYYFFILKGLNIDLSILEIIFISSIGIVFLIIPIKSIAGFGTTEGSWVVGMLVLGYSKEIGVLSGFATHIIALTNVTILFVIGYLFRRMTELT